MAPGRVWLRFSAASRLPSLGVSVTMQHGGCSFGEQEAEETSEEPSQLSTYLSLARIESHALSKAVANKGNKVTTTG